MRTGGVEERRKPGRSRKGERRGGEKEQRTEGQRGGGGEEERGGEVEMRRGVKEKWELRKGKRRRGGE